MKKTKKAPEQAVQRPFEKLKALKRAAPPAKEPAKPRAPVAPRATSTSSDVGRSDAETFAIYMAGVRAFDAHAVRIPKGAANADPRAWSAEGDPKAKASNRGDDEARAKMRTLVAEGVRFETTDDGERIEGRRLDVDPREVRRLRRGAYPIDGKLDLHGFALEEARAAVEAFVKKRGDEGDRVVVLVHGKGTHSPRGMPVLRGEIAAWLTAGRSSRHVAAFATAPDDDGGNGALLVLLAR